MDQRTFCNHERISPKSDFGVSSSYSSSSSSSRFCFHCGTKIELSANPAFCCEARFLQQQCSSRTATRRSTRRIILLIPFLFAPSGLYAQGMATPKASPSALVQSSTKATPAKTSRSAVKHVTPPQNVTEGPPKRLSLKEAESIALRNAPSLGSAYFTAQAAKDVVKEARSQFFPQIQGDIEAVGTANAIRNAF